MSCAQRSTRRRILRKIGWCRRADSNRQPIAYEAIALPLSYCGVQKASCSKLLSNKPPPVEEAQSSPLSALPRPRFRGGELQRGPRFEDDGLDSRLRGNERKRCLSGVLYPLVPRE